MVANKQKCFIQLLEPSDTVTGFSVGAPEAVPLKTYFQRDAKRFQAQSIARTYVMRLDNEPKIVAYMTLVCGEIEAKENAGLAQEAQPFTYESYPAIKVARLLVDARFRKRDLGRTLIDVAVGTAKQVICPAVGCRFVVVDAKQESVSFYERCGFSFLETAENRSRSQPVMFIDLHKTALKSASG